MTPDAREKIFQATMDLVTGGADAERITTRQIGAKAGVNPALVNYYYQSKENLLSQVVGMMMGGIISQVQQGKSMDADAETRLRSILITTADAAFKYHNVCKVALTTELKQGCKSSCDMVIPLLKEMFEGRNESDLKVIALQLMLPFHHIVLDPELYNGYLNTDFLDEQQRRQKINQMVDCVLAGLLREVSTDVPRTSE
ncbi:MAG TPA: TetR/AcrR family transcriptional regulator [Symbiobacteriaceae bacterium]|nr:TetR/AcrR family transcriptional regulator [Symbiobacteriaceae bacterium]